MSRASAPLGDVPIERHGVVGDRRTAALVAADGTVDWHSLPDDDGPAVVGALLDADRGGACRLGPTTAAFGRQRYAPDSALLLTTWQTATGALELTDAMAWPWTTRSGESAPRSAAPAARRKERRAA